MFHSVNVFTGETLYRRPDQDYAEFERRLADLKMHGRAFAQLGVTERAARLQKFAYRLEAEKERFAEMVCEEVGRCLHECRAEIVKSIELIRYYARLAPNCSPTKPLRRRRV